METREQIPIWFFIGVLLLIYGVLITATGLYHLVSPPEHHVELSYLHADVWWGALIAVLGAFYVVRYNPRRSGS
jgi:divalent metal cation (Fe/Co/Zn/Cd) transporter